MNASSPLLFTRNEMGAKQCDKLEEWSGASIGETIEPLLNNPLQRSGKVKAASSIFYILDIYLCIVDIQMVASVSGTIEGVNGRHLEFLWTWHLHNLSTERD